MRRLATFILWLRKKRFELLMRLAEWPGPESWAFTRVARWRPGTLVRVLRSAYGNVVGSPRPYRVLRTELRCYHDSLDIYVSVIVINNIFRDDQEHTNGGWLAIHVGEDDLERWA